MNEDQAPSNEHAVSRRTFLQAAGLASAGLAMGTTAQARPGFGVHAPTTARAGPAASEFTLAFENGGITSLRRAGDVIDTEYVEPERRLGDVILAYRRSGAEWTPARTAEPAAPPRVSAATDGTSHEALYAFADGTGPALELRVRFEVEEDAVRWRVAARNAGTQPIEIGDLAIPLPISRNRGQNAQDGQPPILKHSLISGHGSFLFWMRGNSVGPFLTMIPDADTHLEYWESGGGAAGYRVFIHSAAAGAVARERGCTWRQPNTSLTLDPAEERRYGFSLHWGDDYDGVRRILFEEGLIDTHVVPGMTVPTDLFARFALRTRQPIRRVEAEHPNSTTIRSLGRNGDAQIYEVRFTRLGENRLTVRFGDDRHLHLEFFCTEPIETLIRKRASFIAAHQHRDPNLWYDGLLAEWAMDTHVLLGPDNYDRIRGWRIYEVTCDDPGLSKPAFLAAKNAEFPVQREVEALDYYIENFVWGGLQRTADETFSYGIYGIPDWKTNRESDEPGRDGRQHIWRIYDYSHIALMYFSLYRVARHHPHIATAMRAMDYLRRAYGTALAMFTIPWEVERWSAYGTGLYNELVIEHVIDALEAEGMRDEAERLRPHWERKVRTFVNDRPDLFRSEYAFDSTGFESTHALAKYAFRMAEREEENERLRVTPEAAQQFMQTQMAANLFCRGWLETAYYYLGSDYRGGGGDRYTLTYMSQMGGWSVLDYALHHASEPAPYLRLGYASYLSAWALMNTGTPESNYGYWYPGRENDGGAGGGFEPSPYGETWLQQPHSRGSWYYSCEIDLGFCGALRGARTVLADDPLFGRFCFGGDWRADGRRLEVTPKDGVRRRFHARLSSGSLDLESEVDHFARGQPIALREDLAELSFRLESDNRTDHTAFVRIAALPEGRYTVRCNGAVVATFDAPAVDSIRLALPMLGANPVAAVLIVRV